MTALTGQVAIVTGASRGIGAATAVALSEAGAKVVPAARDETALHAVAAGITGDALVVPTDVQHASAVSDLVATTLSTYGRLDIAVNNAAGGGRPPTPLADIPVEDFDSAIAISLRSVFLSMKYEIPAMLESGGGSIVNMSSTAGQWPVAGLTGYVTAKSGLMGMTRTAALDYAARGIRINALAPGPIQTENLDRATPEMRERVAATVPARRLGQPSEIAETIVWLCSPAAAFITGTTLTIDGGMLAGMPPFGKK